MHISILLIFFWVRRILIYHNATNLKKFKIVASGKNHIKGPKKRTLEDIEHFSELFEKMIRIAIQNREGENNGKE